MNHKIIIMATLSLTLTGCFSNSKNDKVISAVKSTSSINTERNIKKERGSVMLASGSMSLFQDNTNFEIGDIITIILEENTNAKKNAKTSTSKSSSGKIDSPVMFGLTPKIGGILSSKFGGPGDLSFGYGGENGWEGDGSSSQSNSLNGEISAFVVEKFANGNLRIEGTKKLLINQGEENINISGIVRPEDINSSNTIKSTKVANANIKYFGNGSVGDSNKMGWVSRFFNGGTWFW
jgi:flagellar L-ring protein precursor FlgH